MSNIIILFSMVSVESAATATGGGSGIWHVSGLLIGRFVRRVVKWVIALVVFLFGWIFRLLGYVFDKIMLPFAGTAAGKAFGLAKDTLLTGMQSLLPQIPNFIAQIFQSAIGDILAIVLAIALLVGLIAFGASKRKDWDRKMDMSNEWRGMEPESDDGRDFSMSNLRGGDGRPPKPSLWNRIQRLVGVRPSIDPKYVKMSPPAQEGRCDNVTAWEVTPGKCSKVELPAPVGWYLSQGLEGLGEDRKKYARDLLVPYKMSEGRAVMSYRDAFEKDGYAEDGAVKKFGIEVFNNESLSSDRIFAKDFSRKPVSKSKSKSKK